MDARAVGSLIYSDYLAACRGKEESSLRRAFMFVPRLLYHAPVQATVIVRLAVHGPRWMFGFWRSLLVAKHSIDIEGPIEVGPGLLLPHPVSIVIARGTRIGAGVQIMNHVTIGVRPYVRAREGRLAPDIRDGAILLAQSIVVGPITVGEEALIGARAWIDKDVPAGAMVRGEQSQVIKERPSGQPLPDLT